MHFKVFFSPRLLLPCTVITLSITIPSHSPFVSLCNTKIDLISSMHFLNKGSLKISIFRTKRTDVPQNIPKGNQNTAEPPVSAPPP